MFKSLLIHTCTYYAPSTRDRDGNITYNEGVALSNVRLVPVLATMKSDVGETKDDKLTLYVAPFSSTPQIIPEELAKISFKNCDYTIRSVTPCYAKDGDAVDHYEAALV